MLIRIEPGFNLDHDSGLSGPCKRVVKAMRQVLRVISNNRHNKFFFAKIVRRETSKGCYTVLSVLFMPSLHSYYFCRKFLLSLVSAFFMEHELRCTI